MPKKISYQDVYSFVDDMGYKLISKKYISAHSNLELECDNGHVIYMSWSNIKSGHRCKHCKIIETSKNKMYTLGEVIEYFSQFGYIVVSDHYVKCRNKLDTICPEGHNYSVSFDNFKRGKRCSHCNKNAKLTGEFVYDEFLKANLIPKFQPSDYINAHGMLPFICQKHEHKGVQYINYSNLYNNRGCSFCSLDKRSKDNHYKWNNGKTELNHHLRQRLTDWKVDSLKFNNYRCVLTGYNGSLEVHHLYSFNKIVNDALKTLNLNNKTIGEYTNDELKQIEKYVDDYHNSNLGVCLKPSIHDLFHSLYGYDNTIEQFMEFKRRYTIGEFKDVI